MPLSFKDFTSADYTQDGDEQSAYNSQKRKRGAHDTSGVISASTKRKRGIVGEEYAEKQQQDEALSHAQRIKAKIRMKKIKHKIKLGRERALRKTPNMDVVKKRAHKKARKLLLKKLTKGQDKSEISFARRQDLEKRLDKMKGRVNAIAKKLIPQVRKIDRDRKSGKAAKTQTPKV